MKSNAVTTVPPSQSSSSAASDAVFRKISWRILPLLMVSYMVAYLDRANIGYAQLQMKQTLPWNYAVYGLGAGVFFLGYFLFEIPSNLLLARIGARKTLMRIMVCWGIVAAATMFVATPTEFYIARFLLGVFEAGFFPGVILYFTWWYPSVRRGQAIATFMSATTIAGIIAGPLNGSILKYLNGFNGAYGWQWLFLLQGLPAVVLGMLVFLFLEEKPADAKWLSPAERDLIYCTLEQDKNDAQSEIHAKFKDILRCPKVWILSLVYFLLLGATYTIVFWAPTLIQSWGVKDVLVVGVLTVVPNACGVIGMILIGRSSDRFHERRWHFVVCVALAALGLWSTTLLQGNLMGGLIALSFAVIGIAAATPVFFTLVSEYLPAGAAAAGIALVSSLGNLGPAVSPSINGMIAQHTGSTVYGMYVLVGQYLLAGIILLLSLRSENGVRHQTLARVDPPL